MIKNRPPLSSIPPINKRILGQHLARNLFFQTAILLTGTIFLYKFYTNVNSAPLLKTRKSFSFEADPFSGKVSCSFKEVPNYQHGFWALNNDNQSITTQYYHTKYTNVQSIVKTIFTLAISLTLNTTQIIKTALFFLFKVYFSYFEHI